MFETIDGLLGFIGDLLKAYPNQNGRGNMIADNASFTALATFQTSQLLGFPVKFVVIKMMVKKAGRR